MERKPQQQTLSIRISDSLRDFLERSKQVLSAGREESVSISDVAKILLESAKDERLDLRLEVAELSQYPTEALVAIRKKWEQGQPRSRPEWILLAQYIQIASEELSGDPAKPEPDTYISLLDALLAVRSLRSDRAVGLDRYYLGNLVDGGVWSDRRFDPEVVPTAIENLIQEIRACGNGKKAAGAGRCFYAAVRDEDFQEVVSLNRLLDKHWDTLWRMAARGHWIREERPVRSSRDGPMLLPPVPTLRQGSRWLSVAPYATDVSFAIGLDSADLIYTISSYAQIREFQSMLNALQPDGVWNGPIFHGLATPGARDKSATYQFRRRQDGVMLGFNEENWQSLRQLVQEAMGQPELQTIFRELSLIYGEL